MDQGLGTMLSAFFRPGAGGAPPPLQPLVRVPRPGADPQGVPLGGGPVVPPPRAWLPSAPVPRRSPVVQRASGGSSTGTPRRPWTGARPSQGRAHRPSVGHPHRPGSAADHCIARRMCWTMTHPKVSRRGGRGSPPPGLTLQSSPRPPPPGAGGGATVCDGRPGLGQGPLPPCRRPPGASLALPELGLFCGAARLNSSGPRSGH